MEFIGGLFPLAILAAIIYGIVLAVNRARRRTAGAAPGIGTRQAFFYIFAFAALMVATSGVTLLIGYVVDTLRDEPFVSPGNDTLALGIALTLVGTPAWLLTWRRILKSIEREPSEGRSTLRGLYIYLTAAISLGFFATGLISLIAVAFGGLDLSGSHIAYVVAWGPIWAYHWWIGSKGSPAERVATPFRSLYMYGGSFVFLAAVLTAIGIILFSLFDRAYVSQFIDNVFIEPELWGDAVRTSVAVLIVGAAGWWWHWLRPTDLDMGSAVRQLYIYLFGILLGVLTVVVSLTVVFVLVLMWLFSTPSISPVDEHFRALTGLVPALLAGAALWAYHAGIVAQGSASTSVDSARRIYNYLIASLSLVTVASSFVFLFALFISATVRDAQNYLIDRGQWQGQLSIVLPLLLVGGGLWLYYWRHIQKSVKSAPAEFETAARRIHIYSVFGVSALAALGSLSAALFMFFNAILDSSLSGETLRDAQWAIAVLLSTGIVSAYYLIVIREDRRILAIAHPSTEERRKRVTALVPEELVSVGDRLETSLGYEIDVWAQPGLDMAPQPTEEQIEQATSAIRDAPGERVLVIMSDSGLDVRAYRRV